MTIVVLSGGEEIDVPRLALFEPDVQVEIVGPFTYEMALLNGKTVLVEYDGSRWSKPPEKPGIPEHKIEDGSEEYYQYREWVLYQGWIAHERVRNQSMERYHVEFANGVLKTIGPENVRKIVTVADWNAVYHAAIAPEVTREDLARILRATFQGVA